MPLANTILNNVRLALEEDYANVDLTAQLIDPNQTSHARVISRQNGVLCGRAWFDSCFQQLDPRVQINWFARDGESIGANQTLCEIIGNSRALLTGERCALNFLQTLSSTASKTRLYVDAITGTQAKILDTRKTLPGLRLAQKYAVRVGGGHNQRIGLFDGVLIKENHIAAAGGVRQVLEHAFRITPAEATIQIEVETLAQLDEALQAGAKLILLDNFSLAQMVTAVELTAKRAELEASGGITLDNVRAIAETGVDRISVGALTKDIKALDLSMRMIN